MEPVPPTVDSVLVIAAEGPWARSITAHLGEHGFTTSIDATGSAAFDQRCVAAGAGIVDLGLRSRSAIEVIAAWRVRSTSPVVAVGDVREEAVVLRAYDAGADHVAGPDVTGRQLVARLRSLLRRRVVVQPDESEDGPGRAVVLDTSERMAVIDGQRVALSPAEFDFVHLLLSRRGRLVPRSELRSLVGVERTDRSLDFFVRRVREKLEQVDGQRRIVVVRGVGFRYADDLEVVRPAVAT